MPIEERGGKKITTSRERMPKDERALPNPLTSSCPIIAGREL
jgi:hypothetical protein